MYGSSNKNMLCREKEKCKLVNGLFSKKGWTIRKVVKNEIDGNNYLVTSKRNP